MPPSNHGISQNVGFSFWGSMFQKGNFDITLPETNSKFAPENGWLEYFLVSFWGV